uniref:Uncharacterized mitochondrial protein AtMg00810-like n=1 Tax=Nicotiana tabacum TaxID=4097 RepID=A0A1S3XPZ0_TOBAC|nr:PREDICTED: uncharacterized mitochondrial protein AtMg00810-like [Nicotiana tabacum]
MGLSGAKPATTPMETSPKLTTVEYGKLNGMMGDVTLQDPTLCQKLIGKLMYATITRPDINYDVQTLSQFMQHPKRSHWEAALRVVRYLKNAPGQELAQILADQSQAMPSNFESIRCLGSQKNSKLCREVQLKLNIEACLQL